MIDCNSVIRDQLNASFDSGTRIQEADGDCKVILPMYKPDGDPVILYIIENGGQYTITDEGHTHGALFNSGVKLDTEKRNKRVDAAKQMFDLDNAENEISIVATEDNLGERILDAAQAVLWIGFLAYTKQPYSPSYFKDKVGAFLLSNNFDYVENQPVQAESREFTVDYEVTSVPWPTYIETIQARDSGDLQGKSEDTAFKWIKIGRANENARFFSVVDDEDGVYSKEYMSALFDDSDAVIPWRERDDLIAALST